MTGRKLVFELRRLLTKTEAAEYCRLSLATFNRLCPVRPVDLGSGNARLLRYDMRDLDNWIEELKNGEGGNGSVDLDSDSYLAGLDS